MELEKRCSLLDFILQPFCFCQTLIGNPDAEISGLRSTNIINNLPLLCLLVGILIYHIDIRAAVSHLLIKKKKAAIGNASPLLKIHSKVYKREVIIKYLHPSGNKNPA